ncbi:MAG: hypothetical protein V5A88_05840 [Candidatus Thermoplasmatota archaeon]
MIERSFERYLLFLIIVILLTSVLVGLFSPSSASMEQEERKTLSTQTWTQTTQSDFEQGDTTNLDTSSSPGEVMLDTYELQVGAAESPNEDYYWEPGYTTFPGRDDFNIDRGGEIIEFTVTCAERHSAFKLKILRPTSNQDEYFAAETETFDPESWTIKTWDTSSDQLPIPVQGGDKLGQYTLGDLSTVGFTGENGQYYYNGEITTTPQTMDWADDDVITTMEAMVETHEDSGTLVSSVHDTGPGMYDLGTIHWNSDEPSGTTLTIETRTSPDGSSWSSWEEASNGGEVQSPVDRYIQYRATFETSEGQNTPILEEINIDYSVDTYPPEIELEPIGEWQAQGPYTVSATVTDQHSGVNDTSLEIKYRVDGGLWQSAPMNSIGGDKYSGDIPDQAHGTEVDYYIIAEDLAGNEHTSNENSFTVDKDPPESSITLEGEGPQNGWYCSEVEIHFAAEDIHSGVDRIRYRIDGGDWGDIEGTEGSTSVYDPGSHEVSFYAIDNVGNEGDVKRETFKIDDTKPESSIAVEGPEGEGGWYTGEVEVTFAAEDELSGINYIEYQLNEEGWEQIEGESGSITIDEEGETTLHYRAVDRASNVEGDKVKSIRIDTTPPSVNFESPSPGGQNDWYVEEPTVTIKAEDATSGISNISYRIINDAGEGEWQSVKDGQVELKLEDGEHTVEYLAENSAGLKSSEEDEAESNHFKVDTLEPGLDYEITEPEPSGWYKTPPEVSIFVDNKGGSRIETVQYRLGEESDWESYQGSFEIDKEGQFYLGIRAIDEAGNLNEKGDVEWIQIDMTLPSLNDVDTSDTVWNNEMTVTATISTGESSLNKVILRYEGDDGWKEKEMERVEGEYKATIPGEDVGFSDVDYQIIAEDAAGNELESQTKVGHVGINWWYFVPIPIAIVLIGMFVYWKRRREEQEKLMPVKESKFSKIRQQRGQKLEELKKRRSERPSEVSPVSESKSRTLSSPSPSRGGSGAAVAGISHTSNTPSPTPKSSYERCTICQSPIDPDSELKCQCGKAYHDDCIMMEGNCVACGRGYAEVKSFTEGGHHEKQPAREEPHIDEPIKKRATKEEPIKEGPTKKEPIREKPIEDELEDAEEVEDEEELESEVTKMLEDEPASESKGSKENIWTDSERVDEGKEEPQGSVEEIEDEESGVGGPIECPVCNNELEPGADECWACGADVDKESE